MSTSEKQLLTKELEASTAALKQSVIGMSDEAAGKRPAEDRWSVLEILEHVIIVDGNFRRMAEEGRRLEVPQLDSAREAALIDRALDRTQKRAAPERSLPKGQFTSVDEAFHALDGNLERNRAFISQYAPDLQRLEIDHPRMGKFTAYEAMRILPNHARRHVEQIEDLKRDQSTVTR